MESCKTISMGVLGGGGEVGASCFQLCVNGHQIMLDSGTHPKKEGKEALPAFSLLTKAPDLAIITHAHVDHCGSFPYLLRMFPGVRAHATLPTVRLMDRMLHNSVSVMTTIARERGVKDYPLYEHEDVSYAMRSLRGHEFNVPFTLPLDTPIEMTFHQAGHVLGTGSVLLKMPGHTLFYTSDISSANQELLPASIPLPKGTHVDTLIIESTHGATGEDKVKSYTGEIALLGESIKEVLDRGGCAMVPSFALGRTQEMVNILARLQEEGKIPNVPIYASGLGRAVYEIYDSFQRYLRPHATLRPLRNFDRIGNVWDPFIADDLISQPAIIVATSGMMLPNTPSAMIAQQMVKSKKHGIFFVGYLDHETLGYALLHAEPGAELVFGLGMKPVKVELENIKRFHFSAHAPRQVLKDVVDTIRPKNVVYVHGDPDAIAWMKDHAPEGCNSHAPTVGQTITLEA